MDRTGQDKTDRHTDLNRDVRWFLHFIIEKKFISIERPETSK